MDSSLPQFYPNCPFSGNFSSFSTPLLGEETLGGTSSSFPISSGGAVWGEENNILAYLENDRSNIGVFRPESSNVTSSFLSTPLPERLALLEYDMGLEGIAEIQNFNGGRCQFSDLFEFGKECCSYVQEFKPIFPITGDNWEIKCNQAPEAEDTSIKVERYSMEEKKDRILRYLNKKSKRKFDKTIKYACRKTLADQRVRIRGRFARKNEIICEDDTRMKKSENSQKGNGILYNSDTLQIKSDDEDWIQKAMASLMYMP